MNPLERDLPLAHECEHCGAKPNVRCHHNCTRPHGNAAGPYIIHCTPGDQWDTNGEQHPVRRSA